MGASDQGLTRAHFLAQLESIYYWWRELSVNSKYFVRKSSQTIRLRFVDELGQASVTKLVHKTAQVQMKSGGALSGSSLPRTEWRRTTPVRPCGRVYSALHYISST